jgi:hypothetical protein
MDIPIWLDTLVCQLMEKDPEKRPFDASMVAQALDNIQEKIAAQKSAGVEIATGRRIDVPRGQRPKGEADREAARVLREAATKKKSKRKGRPIYERGWFVAVAVAAVLLGVGGFLWKAFQPPPPEKLYEQAKAWMESKDPEDWSNARDGPIQKFLEHYGDRSDPEAVQMRSWADQVDVVHEERSLQHRMKLNLSPNGEADTMAFSAVKYEEAGDLDDALRRWQDLEKFKDSKTAGERTLGLLAVKRIRDLKEVDSHEKHWRDRIEHDRLEVQESKPDGETELRIATAVRAEMFGDTSLALDYWRRLKDTYHRNADQRTWSLLAAKKVRVLAAQAPHGPEEKQVRRDLVRQKLDLARTEHRVGEARALCRDIIFLYEKADDPELSERVNEARKLLAEPTPKPK